MCKSLEYNNSNKKNKDLSHIEIDEFFNFLILINKLININKYFIKYYCYY